MAKGKTYRIASIPGDGIGSEVVAAALQALQAVTEVSGTFSLDFTHLPWGSDYYKKTGKYVDDDVLDVMRGFDAALFGAVGAPGTSPFLPDLSLDSTLY